VIITAPGEEAPVDYGSGPMVRDPANGKYRRMRLFALTLGCSRKAVRLLVFQSGSRVWAELHEKAFRRLGGAARAVVLDNPGEGALTPDIYDPTLNPLRRDAPARYGAVAMPCRVRDPDRKGKVESGAGHAKRTPLRGLRFESPEEAQAYLDRWEERWANTRIHGAAKHLDGTMQQDQDRPKQTPLSAHQLLWRTERAGRRIGALCHAMHRGQAGPPAIRRMQGVLSPAKKRGSAAWPPEASSPSAKMRCFSVQEARARVTWLRPSAKPPSNRVAARSIARRASCWRSWPTPSIARSRIGANCWVMRRRSAPRSTASCITGACSSAALAVGEPNWIPCQPEPSNDRFLPPEKEI
jgi:hypothetical protein